MQTFLAHRPGFNASETLCPFVSPNQGDTPDGNTYYAITSLVPGVNARFNGTYSVVAVANSWDSPTTSHTVTVAVQQWTAQSQTTPTSTQSVQFAFTPNQLASNMVVLGEMTIPSKELPPQNLNSYYTATIQSSDTNDSFLDILFLDTMGSTVIVQSPQQYVNYYLEAPSDTRDIGYVLGSVFDLDDAVSVLDYCKITGGPLTIEPYANPLLLLYAYEGAPNCQMTYFPHWYEDRLA